MYEMKSRKRYLPQIDGAYQKLKRICEDAIITKYQVDTMVPDYAVERLNKELEIIAKYDYATIYLHYASLIKSCDLRPSQYGLKGLGASSLVAYLLGLSKVDPLDKDCPLYFELFTGIDGKIDPDFDLSVDETKWWQVRKALNELEDVAEAVWATDENGKRIPGKFFIVPSEAEDILPKVKDSDGVEDVFASAWFNIDHMFMSYDIFDSRLRSFLFKLESVCKVTLDYKAIESVEVIEELANLIGWEALSEDKDKWNDVMKFCKPQTFKDVVRIISLVHGTGVWEENGKVTLEKELASFEDIITVREDVYELLLKQGVAKENAYVITEYIRKGKMRKDIANKAYDKFMIDFGVPTWFIESCKKVRYLFSRAHSAEYAKLLLGLAYFYKYYPDEFKMLQVEYF